MSEPEQTDEDGTADDSYITTDGEGGEGTDAFGTETEGDTEGKDDESVEDLELDKKKKKRTWVEKCMVKKQICDELPIWNIYSKAFVDEQRQREKDDIFKRRKPANLRKFPRVQSDEDLTTPHKCMPLSAFQLRDQLALPNKLDRTKMIRIWRNMRANLKAHTSISDTTIDPQICSEKCASEKWPGKWPCTTRDLVKELVERRRQRRKKRRDLFPCDPDDPNGIFHDPTKDFSERKELGHARVPQMCPLPYKEFMVDRAAGERHGLVDGDYILFQLPSKKYGNRVYADVCLRGLKGMHLPELHLLRNRKRTWKFCYYQAVVALLAKTQIRYKFAWGANIDYIYDHAWMLFAHIGSINVKNKQRLDDVVVYNYKYSIEVELLAELNDVPVVTDIPWDYEEDNMRRKMVLDRKELMNVKLKLGSEKFTDEQTDSVHEGVERIAELIYNLPIRYHNCILRTSRFCLAFWKDNLFWYLYNPYRCDEFGYWDDNGYACILKFCTKESMIRHLMILLLRAHIYTIPKSDIQKAKEEALQSEEQKPAEVGEAEEEILPEGPFDVTIKDEEPGEQEETWEERFYTVQIFHVIYNCCQIHNLKLLQKGGPKPAKRLVKRKTIDDCPYDPLDVRDPCTIEQEQGDERDAIEKPTWLKLYKITWAQCAQVPQKKKTKDVPGPRKMRWHQYIVEQTNKLFSLWGEIHITDGMFERENRGMQTYACYVVCAGMTRIMAPEYWSSKTLDVIVMCGDRYYTQSKQEAQFKSTKDEYSHVNCWNRYLMSHFKIGETMFEAKVLPAICGRLYSKAGKYLWQSLEQLFLQYHFGILTCESTCLGIFKFCGAYYMCDVNSLGPPLFQYGEGSVYMLRTTYFYKFVSVLVLSIGSPECSQFALNPIEILKVVDLGPSAVLGGRMETKGGKRVVKVECPYEDEKKKQMKRWKHRRQEAARTIDKLCCKGGE